MISRASDLLRKICFSKDSVPTVIVAAHPDDEVIGLGYRLFSLRPVWFIYLTDGAPHNMQDAVSHGFVTCEEYARARRDELERALSLLELSPGTYSGMWFADQTACWHLQETTKLLVKCIQEIDPDVVITHPYEGGHPDHDAAAFAVSAALRMIAEVGRSAPVHLEFASYNKFDGIHRWLTYPFPPTAETCVMPVPEEGKVQKQALLDCFKTQKLTLEGVPLSREPLRIAPAYHFTVPPHPGKLNYEYYSWGMTGNQFRILASEALRALELRDPL